MQVDIHPAFWPGYYSMVMEGIRRAGCTTRFTTKGFPSTGTPGFYVKKDTLALIVRSGASRRRIVVAADDPSDFHRGQQDWACLIAKVNIAEGEDGGPSSEVLPVGPLFGVRTGGAARFATTLAWKTAITPRRLRDQFSFREEVRGHFNRRPIGEYFPKASTDTYIFFAATSWVKHTNVAPARAEFIRACQRAPGIQFEGGFVPREDNVVSDFPGLYVSRRYSIKEYIERTQRSICVFNSPAVHGCLGWKLGEFLALGKAIVSTPISRVMPGAFDPGEHYLPTDGSPASLDEALRRLVTDTPLRRRLELRARQYYETYLDPQRLFARMLAAVRI